ncbi:MAG: alcohol dehydrogenase [Thermoprotei archaeon]|nr:MAG: alcohol dehydrogenase [Thermoprotei archaeon]
MKAFLIKEPLEAEVVDLDIPTLSPSEVLVRVKACGICGTDIHIYEGKHLAKYPIIPGHEISGEVVATGEAVEDFKVGDRVVINPNIYCGRCYYCRKGYVHFCEKWIAIGIGRPGGYAEFVAVPEKSLHRMPNNLSFEEAALVEPIACCLRGQDLIDIRLGDRVLIYGLGPIGLIHLQLAKLRGASLIIGAEIIEKRIELGENLGADVVLNPTKDDVAKVVKELTHGRGVDVVIEATGNPKVLEEAINVLDYGGRILVFGVSPPESRVPISPFVIYRKELRLVGSFTNPLTTDRAISVLASRTIRVTPLITHKIELNEVLEYFKRIIEKEKDIVKVLVTP